ncbi:hypothetical protein B5E65_14690 [Gemmiger sp. An120]|uniref:hypothetical protein n=1 Tax=Gemmiger sp. An120 TaxID=1965549 RepID=UPI000B3A0794|nr:hypothetical protein [Gemmiger sp. An120]OUQ40313.1 hypothetical protein B5E65_14690 [Gemmiger sp. An120]
MGKHQVDPQQAARPKHRHQAAGPAGKQLQDLHPSLQNNARLFLGLLRVQQRLSGGILALGGQRQQLAAQNLFPQASQQPVPFQAVQPFFHRHSSVPAQRAFLHYSKKLAHQLTFTGKNAIIDKNSGKGRQKRSILAMKEKSMLRVAGLCMGLVLALTGCRWCSATTAL